MSVASKSRFIFLIASSLLALLSVAIISSCLFSVSFRYITDHEHLKGTRYYGLIRYCFESELGSYGSGEKFQPFIRSQMVLTLSTADDSNADVCYLRTAAPKYATKIEYKAQYGGKLYQFCIPLSLSVRNKVTFKVNNQVRKNDLHFEAVLYTCICGLQSNTALLLCSILPRISKWAWCSHLVVLMAKFATGSSEFGIFVAWTSASLP